MISVLKAAFSLLSVSIVGSVSVPRGDGPDPACKDLQYIEAAGEYGDGKAAYQLAQMYFKGVCGVPHDDHKALQLIMIASMRGYSQAQLVAGVILHNGGKDSEALAWARRAAEQGEDVAQLLISELYLTGKGVTHNFEEAAKWALRSAEQGNSAGQGTIADLYNQGVGVKKNPIEADKWLILSMRRDSSGSDEVKRLTRAAQAEWEKPMSAADVAEAHRRADAWKPKPKPEPHRISKERAMHDCLLRNMNAVVVAVLSLAFLGSVNLARGDEPDPSCKDLRYIEAAGAYGDPKDTYKLAQMYFKGVCVSQDNQKGLELLFIASMRGYSRAQFVTASLLHKGGKDSEALAWARRSAEQGDADAQLVSSELYLSGKGVTHNFEEGAKWALRSAEQGDSAAQGVIADLYDQGVGVNKNPIEADKWLLLCNRTHLGQRDATSIGLADLQKSWERAMPAADVAEAHRRAEAWKPKPEPHHQ